MKALLLLLPAFLCLPRQETAPTQGGASPLPEVPRAVDTPQGKVGPLGVTYPDQQPIVAVWLDLPSRAHNEVANALRNLGWDLDYQEAYQEWISGEGEVLLEVRGNSRPAVLTVGERLLLRGTAANVAALREAIEALAPQLQRKSDPVLSSQTFRARYLSPDALQRIAGAISGGQLQLADAGNGSLVVKAERRTLDELTRWLAEHDQPPPSGTLVLDAYLRLPEGQTPAGGSGEIPKALSQSLAELYPGQRFVRAEGAFTAFSAVSGTPLSLSTTLFGLAGTLAPGQLAPNMDAQLRLTATIGSYDPAIGAVGLSKLLLTLDLPTGGQGVENHSLSTELVLTPGQPTLLGSLKGNRVLFALRLLPEAR